MAQESSTRSPLDLPAQLSAGCCIGWLVAIFALRFFDPNAPPVGKMLGLYAIITLAPGLGLAGAWAALKRKQYRLAILGALCLFVPFLGPWFGLTFPLGFQLLALLRRPSIQKEFETVTGEIYLPSSDAEDQLAKASKLDGNGDWEAAIAMFRDVAKRWPEHSQYVENCIATIQEKQRTGNH